ncbi:hypothetical protein [Photobacterium damselae]|uniref:hypothetical protein n=1 Tax=Photobacterium damselae TaxID=38293 RepID=UPI001302455E|nr:hypothetical protein [Photobacterium damselae]
MYFYEYLKTKINKKSNKEIIAKLNLFHPIFKNLDEVTFSRWVNNKVKPSNKKIALIVIFFNDDYINTMSQLKLKPTNNMTRKAISIKQKKISDPYFSFYDDINILEMNSFQEFPDIHFPKTRKTIEYANKELKDSIKKIILFRGVQTYVYSVFLEVKNPFFFSTLQKKLNKGLYVITPPTYQTNNDNHREILFIIASYISDFLKRDLLKITVILVARTNNFTDYYKSLGYKYTKKIFIDKKEYYLYETLLIDHITSDVMIDIINDF